MTDNIIGRNIKQLRESTGFTQANIADFLGVKQSMISKIESGERCITADMLEKFAMLCGVPVEALENNAFCAPALSYAFRGQEIMKDDMEAICAVNRIALNSDFLSVILEDKNK